MIKAKEIQPIFSILAAALILRVAYLIIVSVTSGTSFFFVDDTITYVIPARYFLNEGAFLGLSGGYDALRTPGYPFILSVLMILLGDFYFWGLIFIQIALNITAIYFLYMLCLLLGAKNKTALLAACLAAMNFLDISYSVRIATDSMVQSLMMFCLYFFTSFLLTIKNEKSAWRPLILGSIFLSFSVLIRPSIMYLPFALIIGFAFLLLLNKQPKKLLSTTLIILLIAVLPMGGWIVRNAVKVDFAGYSSVASIQLYAYNAAVIYAKQHDMDYYSAVNFLLSEQEEELKEYFAIMPKHEAYTERAMELIREDFPTYLGYCALGVACLFFYPGTNDILSFTDVSAQAIEHAKEIINDTGLSMASVAAFFSNSQLLLYGLFLILNIIILILIFFFALVGFLKTKLNDWYIKAMYIGVLAYVVLVSCQPFGFGAYPRYRLGFSMIMLCFAAFGADEIHQFFKKRKSLGKAKV